MPSNSLNKQQIAISKQPGDFRISNLASFLHKNFITESGSLLDVGAGNGIMLKFFKKKDFKVVGMELSQNLCDLMRKDPQLNNVTILNADISKKMKIGKYDYVLACDVVEHIKYDIQAVKNLISYLKPDGTLLVSVPAHSFLFGKRDIALGHFRRYDKKKLLKATAAAGGRVVSCCYWNFIGFFLYLLAEKVLKRQINDSFRYRKNLISRFISFLLSSALKVEEVVGPAPIGLTLIACIKKQRK